MDRLGIGWKKNAGLFFLKIYYRNFTMPPSRVQFARRSKIILKNNFFDKFPHKDGSTGRFFHNFSIQSKLAYMAHARE
jgi:hypothetical protein